MSVEVSEALGVDIGGVIIDRVSEDDRAQTMGAHGYAAAAEVEGACEAIARLAQQRFRERIWLVSRCDEPRESVLMNWLERRGFFGSTGIPSNQVLFCRQRHEKAAICRQLGATHFIDDRLEVLSHLVGTVPHLYLFRSRASDVDRFRRFLPHVRSINRWGELVDALLGRQ
jgi:hypothetical protein